MIPKPLIAALCETDAWIEYGPKYINYSAAFDIAKEQNPKLRHLCLEGMTASNVVRCIGRVDFTALEAFMTKLAFMIERASRVRITTPAGQDVQFVNQRGRPITVEFGKAEKPGSSFQPGVIAWTPSLETVNGIIVFDGAVNPPIGLLGEPIRFYIEQGHIKKIAGSKEAVEYESWLRRWNHPQMLRLAHVSIGCNPEARLSDNNSECERVWGTTQWGIGHIGQVLVPDGEVIAPSHSDGICMNSSAWLDGVAIMEVGQVVHPELRMLAQRLGR